MSEERGKLDRSVTVKCDAPLLDALDRYQRLRERLGAAPLTRAMLVRLLIEEAVGMREPPHWLPTRARVDREDDES